MASTMWFCLQSAADLSYAGSLSLTTLPVLGTGFGYSTPCASVATTDGTMTIELDMGDIRSRSRRGSGCVEGVVWVYRELYFTF
jgi:hypothetical protein